MSHSLEQLIERARKAGPMSAQMQEAQRRSFAYGNVSLENPRITREMIDRAADEVDRSRRAR